MGLYKDNLENSRKHMSDTAKREAKNQRTKARNEARKAANIARDKEIQKEFQKKNGGLSRKKALAAKSN